MATFELSIKPLDSYDNTIVIDSEHYFPWIRPLYRGESGIYDLGDVMLEKERTLRGIVRDGETGTPMEGVSIGLNIDRYFDRSMKTGFLSSWFGKYRTKSNEKGEYLLNKLPRDADSLELFVVGHGHKHTDIPTDVAEFDIDLVLQWCT